MKDEAQLKATLLRLETSVQEILRTRGYSKDSKSLKLLQEMIREQLTNENTRSATRQTR